MEGGTSSVDLCFQSKLSTGPAVRQNATVAEVCGRGCPTHHSQKAYRNNGNVLGQVNPSKASLQGPLLSVRPCLPQSITCRNAIWILSLAYQLIKPFIGSDPSRSACLWKSPHRHSPVCSLLISQKPPSSIKRTIN